MASMLRTAAMRHVEFHYGQMAELYAHASPETQRLMEDSLLVVVDFDRAIEMGVVRVSKELMDISERAKEVEASK